MKKYAFVNSLTFMYGGIKVLSFNIIKYYKCESFHLRFVSMRLLPSWLLRLRTGDGLFLYDEFEFNKVNKVELNNLSRPFSIFLYDFLEVYQNIERYPSNLDVEYNIEKLPLTPHQLKCFKPLLSLKANLIEPGQLRGMSLKDLSRGVILKHLRGTSLFRDFNLNDIIIKGSSNIPLELIFFLTIEFHFFEKGWENWLEFAKKNLLWYNYFSLVERSALISDLGYKFDFIPAIGFYEDKNFYSYEDHSFVSCFAFPAPNDISLDSPSRVVYWTLNDMMGDGFRKRLTLFHEMDLIDRYFWLSFLRSVGKSIPKWKTFLENKK